MRRTRRSRTAALGAALLLLLAACGSPEDDAAPDEDTTSQSTPDDTEGTEGTEGTEDSEDSEAPDAPGPTSEPEESDEREQPEDDDAAADFSTDLQESAGFPGEFTRGEGPHHLVDIRSDVHEGYERVVFEFTGDGTPSWRGEYTDAAVELGRGEPIELAGDHILEININGPSWAPGDEPADGLPTQQYYERDRGGAFEEIFIQGPFEAHSQYLIGVDQERPFQIQLLEEPTRLVVDLQTRR